MGYRDVCRWSWRGGHWESQRCLTPLTDISEEIFSSAPSWRIAFPTSTHEDACFMYSSKTRVGGKVPGATELSCPVEWKATIFNQMVFGQGRLDVLAKLVKAFARPSSLCRSVSCSWFLAKDYCCEDTSGFSLRLWVQPERYVPHLPKLCDCSFGCNTMGLTLWRCCIQFFLFIYAFMRISSRRVWSNYFVSITFWSSTSINLFMMFEFLQEVNLSDNLFSLMLHIIWHLLTSFPFP